MDFNIDSALPGLPDFFDNLKSRRLTGGIFQVFL